MKAQKGVTLISLTIYIVVMTIVISVISMISTYFFKNTRTALKDIEPITEQTRFNSFFTEEVNHNNIKILACDQHYVVFSNDVQYTFVPENKGIYRNQVKICRGVENCEFERIIKNGRDIIEVTIKIEKAGQKKTDYTLKN